MRCSVKCIEGAVPMKFPTMMRTLPSGRVRILAAGIGNPEVPFIVRESIEFILMLSGFGVCVACHKKEGTYGSAHTRRLRQFHPRRHESVAVARRGTLPVKQGQPLNCSICTLPAPMKFTGKVGSEAARRLIL